MFMRNKKREKTNVKGDKCKGDERRTNLDF
jgi:hypothetical protein